MSLRFDGAPYERGPYDEHLTDFQILITEHVRRFNVQLEWLCLASMRDPQQRGILVTTHGDGQIVAELDASVPWMTIEYKNLFMTYPIGNVDHEQRRNT